VTSSEYLASLFSLEGRTAVVTGGSSGIGRAIATALAGAGARTVLVARDPERLGSAQEAMRGDVAVLAADLGSRDGVRAAAEALVALAGEPDVVVSAAGVNLRPPMAEIDEAVWDATMRLNLDAPFLLGQRFGPGMAQRGYGRLIAISSQQAHRAFVDSGAYGVSKAALEGLARSQAEAWSASGVTSNVLVPGFVLTPLNARLQQDPARVEALAARTMVGRNGLPDDFATAALFLASPASGSVTGQAVFVDGGFSVH
jgi:gluconate 5-dehydrogenase